MCLQGDLYERPFMLVLTFQMDVPRAKPLMLVLTLDGRPKGTTLDGECNASDGRPLGTTIDAGFDASDGHLKGTTTDAGLTLQMDVPKALP